jgi:hypothetical protein
MCLLIQQDHIIYISIPIVILKISRRTYIQLNLIMIKVSSNIVGRSIGES